MFQTLTSQFNKIFDKLRNAGTLSTEHVEQAMRDVRIALLEADVALPVVKALVESIKNNAIGQEVIKSVSPAQMVIKIVHDEIISVLNSKEELSKLNLQAVPPVNILMVGLQGSGKTTASAKIAFKLAKERKKILLVSLDVYRPAAQEQLALLASSAKIDSLDIIENELPLDITRRALAESKLKGYDVVIYDTAGRLHIDEEMLQEVIEVKKLIKPTETILVADAMLGQDAVNIARSFDQKLDISGVLLSRVDGDTRGGAILSIKYVTNKPIKYLSVGEKLDDLEEFNSSRTASRILDMGDIVSFVERASTIIDEKEAHLATKKLQKGKFDLNDYLIQLKGISKLGGIKTILSMLPGVSRFSEHIHASEGQNNKVLKEQEAIILSMTMKERRNPSILNASRKRRIASGAGTSVQRINILLKQFMQIKSLMEKTSKMDAKQLMRSGLGKFFS